MEDQSNMIAIVIIIWAMIGFIFGWFMYSIFGWKPEDPDQTTLNFLEVTQAACGFMGMIIGVFAALLMIVCIL